MSRIKNLSNIFFKSINLISSITILILLPIGIYIFRAKLIGKYFPEKILESDNVYSGGKNNAYWAQKIINGGYILHFRHTERSKWQDVAIYDSLEYLYFQRNKDLKEIYFSDAVCLNKKGKIQAAVIAEHLRRIKFPYGYVISSPSCRARQTAEIIFGGYEKLDSKLIHRGPFSESKKERIEDLKNLYNSIPIKKDTNTIVSSHGNTLISSIFSNSGGDLKIDEGGFIVISRKNGELFLEHKFKNFNSFIRQFNTRYNNDEN